MDAAPARPHLHATHGPAQAGQIDFVRLIRSDRLLKILGVKLPVPETLVHRYVTATLHVRRERLVATCEDLWRMEVPFILKP